MTVREAIALIGYHKEYMYGKDCQGLCQALEMAEKALEKQMPKKPNIARNYKVNGFTLICPNCKTILQSDIPYCKSCGQALDWESEMTENEAR